MKFAKLGFKTIEGLSLAHYSEGWSMEYGEGGSYHCELVYNGKVVAELFEEGNGGPLDYRFTDPAMEKEVGDAVLACLKRTDKDYGPNSQYDFCKNATEAGDCEYGTLVNVLIKENDKRKLAEKMLDKGWDWAGAFDLDYQVTVYGGGSQDGIIKAAAKDGITSTPTFYIRSKKPNKIVKDF